MTLVSLCVARALGYRIGILHSFEIPLRMYRWLGFKEYCKIANYTWMEETNQQEETSNTTSLLTKNGGF